ncbi:hypothetical protein GGS26DRAFT_552038 [Hypomontagnella submonticulosa]|nr:hypothetical protein GGS26DRAFT_552038 [Hypomontagnella submonticulosa]
MLLDHRRAFLAAVILCHATLSRTYVCYVMLCYAMPSYAILLLLLTTTAPIAATPILSLEGQTSLCLPLFLLTVCE